MCVCCARESINGPPLLLICRGRGRLNRNKQETNENKYISRWCLCLSVFYPLRDDCAVVSYSIGNCTNAADWVKESMFTWSRVRCCRCSIASRLCAGRGAIECTKTKQNDKWRSSRENRSFCGILFSLLIVGRWLNTHFHLSIVHREWLYSLYWLENSNSLSRARECICSRLAVNSYANQWQIERKLCVYVIPSRELVSRIVIR